MRSKTSFIAAIFGSFAILAPGLTGASDASDLHPVQVDLLLSCHKGLVAWKPLAPEPKCGYAQTPQVKIFDGAGRLRFIGSALDAIQWAKSGQPRTPIPDEVVVRDAVSESRLTHVAAPPPGHGRVSFYVSKP